jgi:hypothetical protein
MRLIGQDEGGFHLHLSRDEMILLNNALNEVLNGLHIDAWEFQTRLGANQDEARTLLAELYRSLNVPG